MNDAFAAEVAEWQAFYAVAAGAAATLIGLVFVALSLNPGVMIDEGPCGLREWAGQTFNSFVTVLVLSLVVLIPDPTTRALGVTLLVIGGQGLVRGYGRMRRVRSDPDPDWHTGHALWRFISPNAAHLVAVAIGIQLLLGNTSAIDQLIAVIFLLVSSAAGSCWELLKEIGNRHQVTRSSK